MRDTRWLESIGLLRGRSAALDDFSPFILSPNWEAELISRFVTRSNAASPAPLALTSYSLTASPSTVTEGNQVTFTISRSGDKPAETVYFSTLSDGTATYAEGDYTTTSGGQPVNLAVSFSSGTTSRTVTLNIVNDGVSDSGEQFRAIVQRNPSDPVSTYLDRSSYVTINDAAASTSYSLTASPTTVTEGNQVTFTISRSGDKPAETIYFSTLSDGTATYAEGDYTTTSGGQPANIAVSFSSGTTSRTVTLNIVNDGVSDSGEQFRAIVQRNSSDPVSTYLDRSSYVTINDAAASTSYSLTASPSTVTEGNQVTFTITRSGDKPAETIYFSTLADGTATYAEGDYTTTSGGQPANIAVSFSSGTTSRTVTLNIVDDGVSDSGEQFRAIVQRSASDPVSTYLDRSSFVTINDAAAQNTTYSLTPASTSVTEGNQLVFTITRSGDKPAETIYFSTLADGTATYAEGDYTTTSGGQPANVAVTFGSGVTSQTVTLNIVSDSISDTGEQFRAIVQRNSSDPVSTYLSRSDFVTINDVGTPPIADDFRDEPSDTSAPLGSLAIGNSILGFIGPADANDTFGDKDVFAVTLTAGQTYDFRLRSSTVNGSAIPAVVFTIRDDDFDQLEISGSGSDVHEIFRADRTGVHYVRVGSGGSSSDTGGYRLEVDTIQPSQVPDDWADDPSDAGAAGMLNPGQNRTGAIEVAGDKDYFTVNLTAGKVYHFSVEAETLPGLGSIDTVALSLRGPNDFSFYRISDDGSGRAGFDFEIAQSGTYYLRMGAGGDSGDTGGYRVSVSNARTPVPPVPEPEPTPSVPRDETLNRWVDDTFYDGVSGLIDFRDGVLDVVEGILKGMTEAEALRVVHHIRGAFFVFGIVVDTSQAIDNIIHPKYSQEKAIFVELTTLMAGLGVAAGTLGVPGGFLLGIVWTFGGDDVFRKISEEFYDAVTASSITTAEQGSASLEMALPDMQKQAIDETDFVVFDESFYLQAYPDVGEAISQGLFGSAYAHFLAVGVDLGYRPNAGQTLTREDLAIRLLNNDPHAVATSALYMQPLGQLSGDGISGPEQLVANALANTAGAAQGAFLDADLSAIAHRKALDLAVNAAGDTIAAASATNAAWAMQWSDGSDFSQVFAADLEALAGADLSSYRLFVVASAAGSAEEVLARFQAQEGWAAGGFDTFGIAEFGGHWVVVVADRTSGADPAVSGPDNLATASIYGSGMDESLYAGLRAGRLFGLDGADTLIGGAGNDHLDGGAGRDGLTGGAGIDTLIGGADGDWLFGEDGGDTLFGGDGADHLDGGLGRDGLAGGLGDDFLDGGADGDFLFGEDGGDTLIGGDGDDRLEGGFGSDGLAGGFGDDFLAGGADTDWLFGDEGIDTLIGEDGADTLVGDGGNDGLAGGAGIDGLNGGFGDDYLDGGAEGDFLFGDDGSDTVLGGDGDDRIEGGAGIDGVTAGAGADFIAGGLDADYLFGEDGADTLLGESGDDRLEGGLGSDGLAGGAGADFLAGGLDADYLFGEDGADTLLGEAGNDHLDGGAGADGLAGGAGADSFAFTAALGGGNVDFIADFNTADDTILLENAVFAGLALGALAEDALVVGTAAQDAGDRIVYNAVTGELFFDADGNGAGAAILFATLHGPPSLSASDFVVI